MPTEPLMTDAEPPTSPAAGWKLLLRGVEVRFRFVIGLALLAGLMAGWPWLHAGWERILSPWQHHRHTTAVSGDTEFFCPMDPGVISAWPAICPICNMDLITRKKADAILLPEGVLARMQISPYRVQLAGIRTTRVGDAAHASVTEATETIVIPDTAVVEHGDDSIVYVETMPGMYDAVRVELGEHRAAEYIVIEGLKAGQRVVTAGAFLVDAESRLNPNLAAQYFGANSQTAANLPPALPAKKTKSDPFAMLSATDRSLVEQQRICPVTEAPLGSMGQPTAMTVQGQKVFLCCRGCEGRLKADPNKFLAKLKPGASENSR